MAFQQTYESAPLNMSGLLDRSAEMAAKSREIGAEVVNLSMRNFESAARAGRALADVRDLGTAARIQMDYAKDVMTAFSDHSARIAEIVMSAGREAGAEAKTMAEKTMHAAGEATRTAIGETGKAADKGFDAAKKFGA